MRVFLDVPDAGPDTPLDHPNFVGMFTLFPTHTDHGQADAAVTLDLDATPVVRKLLAGKKTSSAVSVVTVAFADDGKPEQPPTDLKHKGVQVVIED